MNVDELYTKATDGFASKKYQVGLVIAFVDMIEKLNPPKDGFENIDDMFRRFPRITRRGDKVLKVLVLKGPSGQVSLRGCYDAMSRYFRNEHLLLDMPSSSPYSTGSWNDKAFEGWWDALARMSRRHRQELRKRLCGFLLSNLKSHAFDPANAALEPPLFQAIVQDFDLQPQGDEPTGAALQGVVFGYMRADNPHLQVEISKVRTGGDRVLRVGDIDGWDGKRLAISAEVKQYRVGVKTAADLRAFAAKINARKALGFVVAIEFSKRARRELAEINLVTMDTGDLLRTIALWDPFKQRIAATSLIYYASHVEQNSALTSRIETFIAETTTRFLAAAKHSEQRSLAGAKPVAKPPSEH